ADGRLVTVNTTDYIDDATVHFWDVRSGRETLCINPQERSRKIALSPDGRLLATSGDTGKVRLWDTTTGQARGQWDGHKGRVKALSFSPDSLRLVTGGQDRTVVVWEIVSGRRLREYRGHEKGIVAALFCPDGRHIASGDE